jgi:hypothetical protein
MVWLKEVVMPLSVTCPACTARLRAPDAAMGRTLRCPKCKGPVVVPSASGPPAELAFAPAGRDYDGDDGSPFEDEEAADEPQPLDSGDSAPRKKSRKTAAKKKPAGYNPFDDGGGAGPAAEDQPAKKRKYRKDGDYNPFGDADGEDDTDPAAAGFDFGVETPPAAPAEEFDFGPLDPRRDDGRR